MGVSGAVFLLPVQLSVLQVPSPAVTPTNLLFNIVAIPGALLRLRTQAPLRNALTTVLLIGTVPGVVLGAVIRVFLIPGPQVFRLSVAGFLLPLGIWLLVQRNPNAPTPSHRLPLSHTATTAVALAVGVIGGIYGIGGGSLLSPILVGRGLPVATVAPATLICTFITSAAGAFTYLILAITTAAGHHIVPNWTIGLIAGAGGLVGGYLGARAQPHLPERALRTGLGVTAIATAALYVIEALQ
ncbi:Sulfite exporter TauE/SafE [Mycobacteroides abscessus subsp. massiliense]|nr:Sulfite exporter TauE/SafE [Mycobacteroides abscessus subsp. massiliense]